MASLTSSDTQIIHLTQQILATGMIKKKITIKRQKSNILSSIPVAKSYLVAAAILQCLWSLSLAFVDIYALLVKRSLRNARAVCIFTIGDGITGTLTLGAACASAGITVLIGNDLNICAENHCASFETATAMAFISWFALAPSYVLNFWSMASR
ncbi:CASP-like protein 5A3 isoform X1 [Phragmites australis]|uniref:CASP-like protein 5A3 isoform X1 n=1 Tax=Phragmites australis TaxID=29695 RepID=UPI002D7922C0|nr:CASP-like protein 5A3 isoform X1 [Phragmites australis]